LIKKDFSFPILTIKTDKGLAFFDKAAKTAIAKKSGWVFVFLLPILAAVTVYFVLTSIYLTLTNPNVSVVIRQIGPAINLPWPGLNPYFPIVYGWIALFVALIVHEFAHGIQARVSGVPVKFVGLAFLIVLPLAAFVELDEEEQEKLGKTSFKKFAKTISAGTGTNIITSVIALFFLLLIISSLTPVTNGLLITQLPANGPAYKVGVMPGDILLAVNSVKVVTQDDLQKVLNPIYIPGNNLTLTVLRNSTQLNYTVTLATNPSNSSEGFIGITDLSLKQVTANYLSAITHFSYRDLALYLVIPTLPNVATSIPFSDQLHSYYVSNTFLGKNYFVLADLLYWIWLINFSLGIFNALPLYPLDGGFVFKFGLKKVLGKRIGEKKVNIIVYSVSILLVFLIGFMLVAPYIL
jgi:membrane-associated protease RseP (regulator of RpoE activity)